LGADHGRARILFMSGHTERVVAESIGGRRTAFLQKPFTPEGLAAKVREVLGESARPGAGGGAA
ncbi:MAG: hypothetical protein ACRELB_23775, partial [Polyangiaceae bacterium]